MDWCQGVVMLEQHPVEPGSKFENFVSTGRIKNSDESKAVIVSWKRKIILHNPCVSTLFGVFLSTSKYAFWVYQLNYDQGQRRAAEKM